MRRILQNHAAPLDASVVARRVFHSPGADAGEIHRHHTRPECGRFCRKPGDDTEEERWQNRDYCDAPFDEGCTAFPLAERAVLHRTPGRWPPGGLGGPARPTQPFFKSRSMLLRFSLVRHHRGGFGVPDRDLRADGQSKQVDLCGIEMQRRHGSNPAPPMAEGGLLVQHERSQ
jgi:hypothetical protein